METPLPSRRITRSQASILAKESNKGVRKHHNNEKSALIDITNGSPIVGVAIGGLKTPSSRCSKKRMIISAREVKNSMTPGSGESLLRGQVKSLLQKVEEEGVGSKIGFDFKPWCNKGFGNYPVDVISSTAANTHQVCDFSINGNKGLKPFLVSPVAEIFNFSQMLNEVISSPNQEDKGENVEKNVITRSLFSDFSEKSNDSDSSECNSRLTCQDSDVSLWSVQANASTSEGYEDELCEGMSKISVNNGVKFTGKHIRFVYNSDGELEGELSSSAKTRGEAEREAFEICSGK